MTKNRTRTPVYLDPGMHPGLEVKGLKTSLLYIYYRNMPLLKLSYNSPHFTTKNLPCPFFIILAPKENPFQDRGNPPQGIFRMILWYYY